eukprot:g4705.t1
MPSKDAKARDDTVIAEEVLRTYCPAALQDEYASITDPTWKASFVKNFLESLGGMYSRIISEVAMDGPKMQWKSMKSGDPHWVLAEALKAGTGSTPSTMGAAGIKPEKGMLARLASVLPRFGADDAHGGGATGWGAEGELQRTFQAMFGGLPGSQSRSQQIVQQHKTALATTAILLQRSQESGMQMTASCHTAVKKGRADLLLGYDGATMHPSEFACLRPIGWKDLKTFTVLSGCVLKGTIVTDPAVQIACQTVLQDAAGECVRVAFYNVLPVHLSMAEKMEVAARKFGEGCEVSIANPFYKVALDGSRMVRVDDPRDILVEKLPRQERARKAARTLAELKEDGNKLVAQQKYEEAVLAYKSCFSEECGKARDEAVAIAKLLLLQRPSEREGNGGNCLKPIDALRVAAAARILCGPSSDSFPKNGASTTGEKKYADPSERENTAMRAQEMYTSSLRDLGYEELSKRALGWSKNDMLLCDELGPGAVLQQHREILLLCATASMVKADAEIGDGIVVTCSMTITRRPGADSTFDVAAVLSNLAYVLLRADDPLSSHAYSMAALAVTELLPTADGARAEKLRTKIALRLVEALVSLGEVDAARAGVEAFATDVGGRQARGHMGSDEAETACREIRRLVDPKQNALLLLPGISAEENKSEQQEGGPELTQQQRNFKVRHRNLEQFKVLVDTQNLAALMNEDRCKKNRSKESKEGGKCVDKDSTESEGAQDETVFLVPFEWVHPAIETRFVDETKGRGLIALEDIAEGTPLMVVKQGALAAYSGDAADMLGPVVERCRYMSQSQCLLRDKVIRLATENPAVAWRLHHLVTNDFSDFYAAVKNKTPARLCELVCDRLSPVVLPCLPPGRESLVDGLELFAKKVWNQFTARKVETMLNINIHGTSESKKKNGNGGGSVLYPSVSLMNHADDKNTQFIRILSSGSTSSTSTRKDEVKKEKLILLIATEDIRDGDEVTIPYSTDREVLKDKWGICTPSVATKKSASGKSKKQK